MGGALLTGRAQAQLAVGNMGLPVLVSVLHEDRDDLELVRGALECLVAAMLPSSQQPGADAGGAATGLSSQEQQAAAINAELFARKPEQVQLLLNLLEDEPVRWCAQLRESVLRAWPTGADRQPIDRLHGRTRRWASATSTCATTRCSCSRCSCRWDSRRLLGGRSRAGASEQPGGATGRVALHLHSSRQDTGAATMGGGQRQQQRARERSPQPPASTQGQEKGNQLRRTLHGSYGRGRPAG